MPLSDFDEVTVVGFDYLSEFSIFCGLISAFGLDIHSGDIYSFSTSPSHSGARKIVDVFHVRAKPGAPFNEDRQESFIAEMQRFARLLATGDIQEPRERLNRFLVERIETMNEPLTGLLSPVEIVFDNEAFKSWSLMQTQGGRYLRASFCHLECSGDARRVHPQRQDPQ